MDQIGLVQYPEVHQIDQAEKSEWHVSIRQFILKQYCRNIVTLVTQSLTGIIALYERPSGTTLKEMLAIVVPIIGP